MADPRFRRIITAARERMNGGGYARDYIELFVSSAFGSPKYSLNDAYVFGRLSGKVWTGEFVIRHVRFTSKVDGPEPDAETEENNRLLSSLERPFTGWFKGGPSQEPGDGMIAWSERIQAERMIDRGDGDMERAGAIDRSLVEVKRGEIVLEVGTTRNYNVFHRLEQEAGVARWPYHCDHVTLLLRHDSFARRPR